MGMKYTPRHPDRCPRCSGSCVEVYWVVTGEGEGAETEAKTRPCTRCKGTGKP